MNLHLNLNDKDIEELGRVYRNARKDGPPKNIRESLARIKAELPPKRLREYEEVEKIGVEELPTVTRLVRGVKQRMGVLDRIIITPDPIQTLSGRTGYMGMNIGGELVYGPGVTDYFTSDMLAGVIAHEIGHHVNGDPQRKKDLLSPYMTDFTDGEKVEKVSKQFNSVFREQEYAADKFAATFGYGSQLIAALRHTALEQGGIFALLDDGDSTHPNVLDRIRRLRQYDEEQERKAA